MSNERQDFVIALVPEKDPGPMVYEIIKNRDPGPPMDAFPYLSFEELKDALNKMPGLWLAVGGLRVQVRRCKPGSKKCLEIEAKMLRMESEAMELSSKIRMDLYMRQRANLNTPKKEG